MNDPYLIDTHALHWHWANPAKLPPKVRVIFSEANAGETRLIVSFVVLLELFYLYKKLDGTGVDVGHRFTVPDFSHIPTCRRLTLVDSAIRPRGACRSNES